MKKLLFLSLFLCFALPTFAIVEQQALPVFSSYTYSNNTDSISYKKPELQVKTEKLALGSTLLGVLSVLSAVAGIGVLFGLIAIIGGKKALARIRKYNYPEGANLAQIGIVTGVASLLLFLGFYISVGYLSFKTALIIAFAFMLIANAFVKNPKNEPTVVTKETPVLEEKEIPTGNAETPISKPQVATKSMYDAELYYKYANRSVLWSILGLLWALRNSFGGALGLIGIVFGLNSLDLSKKNHKNDKKSTARAGIVLGLIAVGIALAALIKTF